MARSKPYRVDIRALQEIEAADDWYLQRSVDASAAFLATISDALDTISQSAAALAEIPVWHSPFCSKPVPVLPLFIWMSLVW